MKMRLIYFCSAMLFLALIFIIYIRNADGQTGYRVSGPGSDLIADSVLDTFDADTLPSTIEVYGGDEVVIGSKTFSMCYIHYSSPMKMPLYECEQTGRSPAWTKTDIISIDPRAHTYEEFEALCTKDYIEFTSLTEEGFEFEKMEAEANGVESFREMAAKLELLSEVFIEFNGDRFLLTYFSLGGDQSKTTALSISSLYRLDNGVWKLDNAMNHDWYKEVIMPISNPVELLAYLDRLEIKGTL